MKNKLKRLLASIGYVIICAAGVVWFLCMAYIIIHFARKWW